MGFVSLFVQTVQRELMYNDSTVSYLYIVVGPRISRFVELLIEFTPRSTESDPSYRTTVLGGLLSERPQQIPGQSKAKTPLPSSKSL